jgi:hypothetical protein
LKKSICDFLGGSKSIADLETSLWGRLEANLAVSESRLRLKVQLPVPRFPQKEQYYVTLWVVQQALGLHILNEIH